MNVLLAVHDYVTKLCRRLQTFLIRIHFKVNEFFDLTNCYLFVLI